MIRAAVAQLIDSAKPSGTILTEDHEAFLALARHLESKAAEMSAFAPGKTELSVMARMARSFISATL